jgi:hypothetical protein
MSKLFEGSLPAEDVVLCLIAVLVLAGVLCLIFLPTRTLGRHHSHSHSHNMNHSHPHKCLMRAQMCDQRVNQETYIDSPPQREMPSPGRPEFQPVGASLAQCKNDYNKCVQSVTSTSEPTHVPVQPRQQVVNQESQLAQPAQREMPGLGLRRQLVSQVQDISAMRPTNFPEFQLPVNTSSRLRSPV